MSEKKREFDIYVTETKYDRDTKLPAFQFTRLNGVFQAPPDGSPSYIRFDEQGRPEAMSWHDQGKLNRVGAGAKIFINSEGIHEQEWFFTHGELRDPSLGPNHITRDPQTGEIEEANDEGNREAFYGSEIKFEP